MRIRRGGSHGGHNGLRNIVQQLGSDAFPRFKLGVGQKPSPDYDLADFVLGRPGKEDAAAIAGAAKAAAEAAELWLSGKEVGS